MSEERKSDEALLSEQPLHSLMTGVESTIGRIGMADEGKAKMDEEERAKLLSRCRLVLEHILRRVRREGVFSSSDELSDIATGDLRMLLTEFYLGQVIGEERGGVERRGAIVRGALEATDAFLDRAERLGFLSPFDALRVRRSRASLEEGEEEGEEDDVGEGRDKLKVPTLGESPAELGMNPVEFRDAKISRLRAQQAAQRRLQELSRLEARAAKAEATGEDGVSGKASGVFFDEELRRERMMLQLNMYARKAADDYVAWTREVPILRGLGRWRAQQDMEAARAGIRRREDDDRMPRDRAAEEAREGLAVMKLSPTLEISEERIRADVFRSRARPASHFVQDADELRTEAIEREARQKEAEKEAPKSFETLHEMGLEDDEKEVDKATYKARQLDHLADSITRGYGNTKRI